MHREIGAFRIFLFPFSFSREFSICASKVLPSVRPSARINAFVQRSYCAKVLRMARFVLTLAQESITTSHYHCKGFLCSKSYCRAGNLASLKKLWQDKNSNFNSRLVSVRPSVFRSLMTTMRIESYNNRTTGQLSFSDPN